MPEGKFRKDMFRAKRKPMEEIWGGDTLNIADKVSYYNKIDMGIYLFMLETCLEHENYSYDRVLYEDTTDDSVEKTLVAK